jgi:hypothetical protein
VTLALASFVPQQVTLSAGKQTATFALAPGLSLYQLPDLPVPTTLVLTPTVAAPLLEGARVTIPHQLPETDPALGVPYVQWHAAGTTLPGLTVSGALLVRCTNENAGELDARCFVANPRSEMLTWRWIVRGTPLGTRQEQVMAQAQAQGAPRSRFDISARTAGGVSLKWDDAAPLAFDTPPLPDGSYRGTLEILRDGALLARLALYNVQVKGQGTSMSRDSHTTPLVIVAP